MIGTGYFPPGPDHAYIEVESLLRNPNHRFLSDTVLSVCPIPHGSVEVYRAACMPKMVSHWRCKCGVRIKVVAEMATEKLPEPVSVACPKCGDVHTIYAEKVISITAETASHAGSISS